MAKLAKRATKKAAKKVAKKAAKQSQKQLTISILERAKELLSKGWTKKTAAKNADNKAVPATAPTAFKFCAFGAIQRSVFDLTGEVNADKEYVILAELGYEDWDELFKFNDGAKTKKSVLSLFSTAIAKLEA
jgi:hypothetical protein